MNVPENLKFAPTHEWIRVEGGIGTVGITDHAQTQLTDIVFAEVPQIGAVFSAGASAAVVESVQAASEIYTPVSGEVLDANPALADNPSLLNTDPYGDGWIFKLRLKSPEELDALLDAAGYRAHAAR